MLVQVKVPQLSESVAEATLLSWHKKAGEYVQRDENLVDIETDKVVLETPAPESGVLARIIKGDGGTVTSNEVIAQIDTEAKAQPAAAPAPVKAEPRPAAKAEAKTAAPAMPAAQKLAAEKHVDTGAITGTGRGGRVTKEDVLHAIEGGAQPPSASSAVQAGEASAARAPARSTLRPPSERPTQGQGEVESGVAPRSLLHRDAESESARQSLSGALPLAKAAEAAPSPTPQRAPAPVVDLGALGERPEQRVPMSRLRARVAERLVQSQHAAAILTTFNEVNMQPVIDLRNRYKDRFEKEHGVRLGFMSFFVKASVHALKKFPVVNASIDGNDIIYHGYYDVGIAVSSPRGLVVPILRDADQLSLAEIEKQIADFGKRAQDGKLTIEELTGGTFSISNGGVFGSMLSTPIINPPQSAILGIHATRERPVAENGQVVIRPINYLALSYDHRIIDGREAVLTLVAIKEALEDPARMLLDI